MECSVSFSMMSYKVDKQLVARFSPFLIECSNENCLDRSFFLLEYRRVQVEWTCREKNRAMVNLVGSNLFVRRTSFILVDDLGKATLVAGFWSRYYRM